MPAAPVELLLIRHAEADHGGRLVGRTDVAALLPPEPQLARARAKLGQLDAVYSTPALRCRMTAEALFPGGQVEIEQDLWEQDFGENDGRHFSEIPDLGTLSRQALAAHCWKGGESFLHMCARVAPALDRIAGARGARRIAIVAHAGTVRAAIGAALSQPEQGLAFEVAPLSVTVLRCHGTEVGIVRTNGGLVG